MAVAPPPALEGYTTLGRSKTDPRGLTLGDLLNLPPHQALMTSLQLAGEDDSSWRKEFRHGGAGYKGNGFLGPLRRPDGGVMTEFSIGVELDGKETEIPTLVPGLNSEEIDYLLNMQEGERLPDSIVDKAVAHARGRVTRGLSPFASPEEEPPQLKPAEEVTNPWGLRLRDLAQAQKQGAVRTLQNIPNSPLAAGVALASTPAYNRLTEEIPGANPEAPNVVAAVDNLSLGGLIEAPLAQGLLRAGQAPESMRVAAAAAPLPTRSRAARIGDRPSRPAGPATEALAEPGMGNLLPEGGITLGSLVDAVAIRKAPERFKVEGTGEGGRVTLEDVARATANPDISGLPYDEQVRIMVDEGTKEVRYQRKQRRSGEGWYRGDVREYEAAARQAFPELEDPDMMGLFKAITAVSSFGNKPKENSEIAFNIWETFRKDFLDLPRIQQGESFGKNWPGGPGFGGANKVGDTFVMYDPATTSRSKLLQLKELTGSWGGVVKWLLTDHTAKEMRDLGFGVAGKADDMIPGAYAFGPKGGPFYRNLNGILEDFTADMWASRTMNRLRGTPFDESGKLPDAPRNDAERKLWKDVALGIADRVGVERADAQAMQWFHEKDLWGKLAGGEDFGTYSLGGRRALESLQEKRRLGTTGTAASPLKALPAKLSFEVAFGENAPYRREYDWSSITPEQRTAISDEHARWLAEEVSYETGVKVERLVTGTGPKNWGANPNAVVRVIGTPGQVRSAMRLLGLGGQQDSVALTREVTRNSPPPEEGVMRVTAIDTIRRGDGKRKWDRAFVNEVGDTFMARVGGMGDHIAIELNVSTKNEPMLRLYPIDELGGQLLADPSHKKRAETALRDIVTELDSDALPLVRSGEYDLMFEGNNWGEKPDGRQYREGLEAAGHSREGLDAFERRVAAALKKAWGKHTRAGKAGPARAQEVGGVSLGELVGPR